MFYIKFDFQETELILANQKFQRLQGERGILLSWEKLSLVLLNLT